MDKENYYTKDAYENNGRYQIHALNQEGLEAYLSKDSYNYHYLKTKYDPGFIKQIHDEVNQKFKSQNQTDKKIPEDEIVENDENKEVCEQKFNDNQNIKKEEKKVEKKNLKNKCNNNKAKQLKNNGKQCNNQKNQNNTLKKDIYHISSNNTPLTINTLKERGQLKDFQQPYHS